MMKINTKPDRQRRVSPFFRGNLHISITIDEKINVNNKMGSQGPL